MRSPPRFQSNLARKFQKEEAPAAVPGLRYHHTFPRIAFARISPHREMPERGLTTAAKWREGQINLRCPKGTAGVDICL
jgi:hypothetical protein